MTACSGDVLEELAALEAGAATRRSRAHVWRRLYLAVPAACAGLIALGQVLVATVDPYSVHPWSTPRPVPEDAAMGLSPYLVRAAARGAYDTVVIGGSTSQGFRPADIAALIAGTAAAANLSYRATRPADLGVVFQEVAASTSVKRVILSLDHVYLLPASAQYPQFPFHLYTGGDVTERLFRFDKQAYELAFRLLSGGDFKLPEYTYQAYRAELASKYALWQAPEQRRQEAAAIEAQRGRVGEPTERTCRDLDAVGTHLVPFARALARSGKTLDVVVPPYALSFYHWALSLHAGLLFTPKAPLENALLLRRCVVEALSGVEGARVFAFDGERWLVEDPAKFHDAGHVYDEAVFRYVLGEVGAGRHQLTTGNFDAYADDLRRRVRDFRYQPAAP